MQALSGFQIAGEPTLEDLGQFIETLRGKKASLYASSKGEFAHHLTSYLTAWGLDVSHVSSDSVDEEEEAARESPELSNGTMKTEVSFGSGSALETLPEAGPVPGSSPASSPGGQGNLQQPSFILIDDDVSVLRTQLRAMRTEQQQPYPLHIGSRKRPSLSAHHRPRSSPQVARAMGLNAMPQPRNTGVIIHFTSLANFKLVKGILQTTLGPNGSPIVRMPEVIVIPKPAGPRRVLTALHTAATKPTVDPFFSPIATSPMSPSVQSAPSYPSNSPRSPHGRPANSPRTNSERSLRSPKDHPGETEARLAPPSPLGLSEGMDYFSEAAVKLGTSPSTRTTSNRSRTLPLRRTPVATKHPLHKPTATNPFQAATSATTVEVTLPVSPVAGITARTTLHHHHPTRMEVTGIRTLILTVLQATRCPHHPVAATKASTIDD